MIYINKIKTPKDFTLKGTTSKSPFHKVSKVAAAAAAKSLQTLCDPRDSSPPGSPVPGICQARVLEWVAIAFSSEVEMALNIKTHLLNVN